MVEHNLSNLLQKNISTDRLDLIHRIADEASMLGFPIHIVGGFVRDLVLGQPSMDFDLVVEGDAIALARSLESKYGGKATVHEKFRTAKWLMNKNSLIDLISARSETYKHPAALPTVKMGNISDDLRRRDFTINTLAIRLDDSHFGELHDELGGLDDLRQGLVRVLHPRSFMDDPTRMYRAVRYEQRYGFEIVKETLALIPEARKYIPPLSAQRIRHELDLILEEPNAGFMLSRLNELDLLKPIHPALFFDKLMGVRFETTSAIKPSNIPARDLRWLLWLMTLLNREIVSVNKRLHFTAPLLRSLLESSELLANLSDFANLKPSQCAERLDDLSLPAICAVALVANANSKQRLEKYLSNWRYVKSKTTGNDLKKLGIKPGQKYQVILRTLKNAWLDREVKNISEEKALLDKILK